ncbi:hypothetical protein Tco_0466146 [Tanacetum coccineum]
MPIRKWSAMDQRRSGIMVNLNDKQLLERRIIRNLERLVGARELETDYGLMQQRNIRVILHSVHSNDGNPTSANIKQALRQVFPMVAAPRDDAEVSTSIVQETTHMVSSVKLPMPKKGEYTIWAIRMEEYLIYTDYEQWLVVLNGNSLVQYTKNEAGKDVEVPPITAKDIQARDRERKAKSALLMALPDVDLPKYHLIKDAKGIWDAIKTRYGELSTEDINSKFPRSLPSKWTNVSMIMRNKEGIDDMDINDLYNTLKAHEGDVKGTTVSSSSSLNMAFVSEEITSSTDEISTTYHVNSAIGQSNKAQGSLSYVDEVMYSFFANQSSTPQLDHDGLEQEESCSLIGRNQLVLIKPRWNALTVIRNVTLQENAEERRIMNTGSYLAAEEELTNYALMAITSSKSLSSASSDTEKNEVILEEKIGVLEWHVKDKTNLLTYHKTLLHLATKEKEETLKEKEDLKSKLKKFENSSKNLTKLLDSQINPKVKLA